MFLADQLIGVLAYGIPLLLVVLIGFYFYKNRKNQ